MSKKTAVPPCACALPSSYSLGLRRPTCAPFCWLSIAIRPAHDGAEALVPETQHVMAPSWGIGYTADAASATSGTVRRLFLSPFCHVGRRSVLLPPPLAIAPSCQTTSLPWEVTSSGVGVDGVVPPTAVTKGDWANWSTPRRGFGDVTKSGPKSPEATSTVLPWAAACLNSFNACRMSGRVLREGRSTSDRLSTDTSSRFTRYEMESTRLPWLIATTTAAPGATAPDQVTSRVTSRRSSSLTSLPDMPACSRSSGGRS